MLDAFEQINETLQSLRLSIESLKSEKSIFDSYVFPIVSSFFSAILGGLIAYWTIRRQERNQFEKENMNASNRCILTAENSLLTLLAIKENYFKELGTDPIQRIFCVSPIVGAKKSISFDVPTLAFIAPGQHSKITKWNQVVQIDALFHNYNELLEIWEKFFEKSSVFKEELIGKHSVSAVADISIKDIVTEVGQRDLSIASSLLERALSLTDSLILDFEEFVREFPKIAGSQIDTRRLKGYGKLFTMGGREESIDHLLERVPSVNSEIFAALLGLSPEEAQSFGSASEKRPNKSG
ncbi:MAG: hypothetical protein ACPGN3_15280 [Opitutales bacterium]